MLYMNAYLDHLEQMLIEIISVTGSFPVLLCAVGTEEDIRIRLMYSGDDHTAETVKGILDNMFHGWP